jgi:hypothetical protein
MTKTTMNLPPIRLPPDLLAPMVEARELRLYAARLNRRASCPDVVLRLRQRALEIEQAIFARLQQQRARQRTEA